VVLLMLVAVTAYDQRVEARHADRREPYHCPECGAPVILKHGTRVSAHFAHLVRPHACILAGETEEHLWMKQQMRIFFAPTLTHIEVPLIPGHRADVVLPSQRLVVECQVSPIDVREWERRTLDYHHHGYAVLLVWAPDRLGIASDEQELNELDAIILSQRGTRVAAEVLLCHQRAFGRVYALATTGQVVAVHLVPILRPVFGGSPRPLKMTRTLHLLPLMPIAAPARITVHRETGTHLAQIEAEYAWWHDS
jgi:hypothetical protein